LEEQLQQTKRKITQHDNLHESIRSLQDQMRQMQTGQIPNYPSRPPPGPQISGPPQQAQYAWGQEDDLYYTTNGDSSNDQVFSSRNSGASANSSFVVPDEKYEKENPFTPRTSASVSSFDEQQRPSTSYFNQGMPAPPRGMSADLSVSPNSRIPKSSSVPSFQDQQQPSISYSNQGLPARPAPMSANLSTAPKSKGPKKNFLFKKK